MAGIFGGGGVFDSRETDFERMRKLGMPPTELDLREHDAVDLEFWEDKPVRPLADREHLLRGLGTRPMRKLIDEAMR